MMGCREEEEEEEGAKSPAWEGIIRQQGVVAWPGVVVCGVDGDGASGPVAVLRDPPWSHLTEKLCGYPLLGFRDLGGWRRL